MTGKSMSSSIGRAGHAMFRAIFLSAVVCLGAHAQDLAGFFDGLPQQTCNAEARPLLLEAEKSIAEGGKPTRQSGWTEAHIDLTLTDELLITEVAREYAIAHCWGDVQRLLASSPLADEMLARVAYQLGAAGDFKNAAALARFIKKEYIAGDVLGHLVRQAVERGQTGLALRMSSALSVGNPGVESRNTEIMELLVRRRRYDEARALARQYGSAFEPADWAWLARAEVDTDHFAEGRLLVRRALEQAGPAHRDEMRLMTSAIMAKYFPAEALENFRAMDDNFLRNSVFIETYRQAQSESVRRSLLREVRLHPGQDQLDKKSVDCHLAYFDAEHGRYERAFRSMQRLHCDRGDSSFTEAFHMKPIVEYMVRRGDTSLALKWIERAPDHAYIFMNPVVWGLAKEGRSKEALAVIEPRGHQIASNQGLFPAVAPVLPADAPFEAWLGFVLQLIAKGNEQQPGLQAMSAAFAKARGEQAVRAFVGDRLKGFQRARVLVGIAQGRRGVVPGQVPPSYWPHYGEP